MHEVLEIIMPQVENVEDAVAKIMQPYSECVEEGEEENTNTFWDFYSIGGRWAGHKRWKPH